MSDTRISDKLSLQRRWYARNKTKMRAYHRTWQLRWRNTPKGRVRELQKDAKKRKLIWALKTAFAEGLVQQACIYCGDSGGVLGIDRLDNERGYTVDNVAACCTACNRAKLTMTMMQYVELCERVAKNNRVKRNPFV